MEWQWIALVELMELMMSSGDGEEYKKQFKKQGVVSKDVALHKPTNGKILDHNTCSNLQANPRKMQRVDLQLNLSCPGPRQGHEYSINNQKP